MECCLCTALAVIGAICVLVSLLKFFAFLKRNLIGGQSTRKYFLTGNKYETWAVVTGASDGIGKAYAESLAKDGFNIVLISRTKAKLDEVAQGIEASTGAKTKVVAADMSTSDFSVYDKVIEPALKGLPIGILVNNVGMSYDYPLHFLDTDHVHDDRLIHINIFSVTRMTKMVLPGMVERRKGGIINLASISGAIPAPMLSVYSASKAFVQFFSECVGTEYKSKGVDVLCVCPSFVATNMSKMRPSLMVPKAPVIARNSLARLSSESVITGYWVHDVIRMVGGLSRSMFKTKVLAMHEDIKRRYLAKKKREAEAATPK